MCMVRGRSNMMTSSSRELGSEVRLFMLELLVKSSVFKFFRLFMPRDVSSMQSVMRKFTNEGDRFEMLEMELPLKFNSVNDSKLVSS